MGSLRRGSMRKMILGAVAVVSALGMSTNHADAAIAHDNGSAITGSQNYGNSLGLAFDVNPGFTISVTDLGVFDNGDTNQLNGVSGTADMDANSTSDPIGGTAAVIYNRNTSSIVAGPVYFTSADTAAQNVGRGDAFKSITPVTLGAGNYIVVGWNTHNFNTNGGANGTNIKDNGGGAISFVGGGFFSGANTYAMPTGADGGPADRYDTATFKFTAAATPEPASLSVLALGGVLLLCRRTSHA